MTLPIPIEVVYAGLAGTLLALIVATAQQKWKPKVFFLLALRLAIGWHFLFEGLHKINSHYVGPTETNKPFSSEMYFKASPTWFGAQMRKQVDDTAKTIRERLTKAKDVKKEQFDKLTVEEWVSLCPPAVAAELDQTLEGTVAALRAQAEADEKAAPGAYKTALGKIADDELVAVTAANASPTRTPEQKKTAEAVARAAAESARKEAEKKRDKDIKDAQERKASAEKDAPVVVQEAKAKYARWVYGAEGRATKVKGVTGEVVLTAPERLTHLEWLQNEAQTGDNRRDARLGNGNGTEQKRSADLRTDLVNAEAELAKDAASYADLGVKPVVPVATAALDLASDEPKVREEAERVLKGKLSQPDLDALREAAKVVKDQNSPEWDKRIKAQYTLNDLIRRAEPKPGAWKDTATAWFISAVGACILFGFLTRINCVLAAGFLVTTYLTWPSLPWLPLPPNTEGNPLFINKNIIECLALLSLACLPTGRWLGLDAIIYRVITGKQA